LQPKSKFFLFLGKSFLEKLTFYLRISFQVRCGYTKKSCVINNNNNNNNNNNPVVVAALRVVSNRLDAWLEKLLGVTIRTGLLQKTALLGTARILRKLLDS